VSRAARDQSQQQLCVGRRRIFDDVQRADVLRLVRCGHNRAPFQSRAVSAGLEKAVKEMLRLMKNYRG
jgi:pyridoxine 5'-phosphate synthase PdxJ